MMCYLNEYDLQKIESQNTRVINAMRIINNIVKRLKVIENENH